MPRRPSSNTRSRPSPNSSAPHLLTRAEAAAFLQVPPKTLATWASRGEGPRYFRVGRHARYRVDDIERWLELHAVEGGPAP